MKKVHVRKSGIKSPSEKAADFNRGAKVAADLAEQYNGSSTHEYRLGDCILYKLNLRKGKPRKNKKQISSSDHTWIRGFGTALAEVYRLLADGNEAKGIRTIAAAAGVNLAALREAEVHPLDIRALRRAGLP